MKHICKFVALGGGQEIGASSYFLNVGGKHFLFDCGKGVIDNAVIGPDFSSVLMPPFLTSLSQIDSIFISHGHFDHIGYLPDIVSRCLNTPVIATELTKKLIKYLIWDTGLKTVNELSAERKVAYDINCANAVNRIHTASYFKKLSYSDYSVTFFEAGHIPGAAMIYLETSTGSILYTGDFTVRPTPLAKGCILPADINPDLIIVCGLYAKKSGYDPVEKVKNALRPVIYKLKRREPVYLLIRQLTKGLELLQIVAELISNDNFPNVNVYIDDNLWELSGLIEMTLPKINCHRFPDRFYKPAAGLYIGSGYGCSKFENYFKIDFSLHATYDDINAFLHKYNPKNVIIVHTDDSDGSDKYALEREFYNTNFIYAQNGQIYII